MRRSRRQPLTDIRAVLAPLRRGEATWFRAPNRQPYARDLYLRINGVAYQLWGAGSYRMQTRGYEISVIRKAQT